MTTYCVCIARTARSSSDPLAASCTSDMTTLEFWPSDVCSLDLCSDVVFDDDEDDVVFDIDDDDVVLVVVDDDVEDSDLAVFDD